MWWKRSAPPQPPAEPAPVRLAQEVADLRADLNALRRDVDDLDETLRSLRGRITKSAALEERATAAAAPANGAAPVAARRAFDSLAIRRGSAHAFPGGGK